MGKKPIDEVTRQYIDGIKHAEPFPGTRFRVSDTEEYRIYIIGRGETAYYQHNDRALLFELIAGSGTLFKKSIKRWDNGDKVTDPERELILERMSSFLRSLGAPTITIV